VPPKITDTTNHIRAPLSAGFFSSLLDCDIFQKNAACCEKTTTVIATSLLLPHREPPALLVVEPELRDGGGFGASFVRRLDGSKWYGARS
jgi:hypothetical protein